MVAAMLASSEVTGQTSRFRCTPLVKLGFFPNAEEPHGTLGINDQAQVVYGYIPPNESNITAWLWLHTADSDYSLGAGFYELRDISTSDAPDPCIAREINEAGYIAGQSDGLGRTTGDARVWNLGNSAVNFTPGLSDWSCAHAVNDDSPPKLTGMRGISGDPCEFRDPERAFRWALTGGSGTLTNLSPVDPFLDLSSIGYDIGLDDTVVGNSEPCNNVSICTGMYRGTTWSTASGARELELGSICSGSNSCTNFGRGVDDASRIVGFTFHNPDSLACRDDATFWANPSDTSPINLGLTMPSGQSGDRSRAYAINNPTNAQVVGVNIDEQLAVLWERDSFGTWSAIDLNTEIPCCRQNITLREAHDINNNGWIVAWGTYVVPNTNPPVIEVWAVLLGPYTCPEDVDFDGDVDETDLNLLLEQRQLRGTEQSQRRCAQRLRC
jgi:hypothetical protein